MKWRDGQASEAYYTLLLAKKPGGPCINTVMMDAVLKDYYTDDRLVAMARIDENPFVAFLKEKIVSYGGGPTIFCVADERVPPDRAYLLPIDGLTDWLPAEDRVKARCPDCDTLQEITPNGADPKKTNKRQRICVHKKPDEPELCLGSGKDV